MNVLDRLKSIAEWLAVAGGYVAGAGLLGMTVGVSLDVSVRYLLGAGTKYATEISGYIVVAIVFLGLAYTQQTKGHIQIDFLIKRLPTRLQRWVRLFNDAVFLAYTLFLGYFG